jgi:TPR repeat protein
LIDLDFVGPKLLKEFPDHSRQSAAKSAIANGHAEINRLRSTQEDAKKRFATLQKQHRDLVARQKAAEDDQEEVETEIESLSGQLKSIQAQRENTAKLLEAIKAEKTKLEQQKESARQQLEAAKEKQKAVVEAREMKKNRPPVVVEKPVLVAKYRAGDFLAKLDVVDGELQIVPTELLTAELNDDENARTVFLAYLWRNVALKDPGACCAYGTLLALGDELSDDLAARLLLYAAEHGEPAAQFNIGVMARRGRGVRKNAQFVAESIVAAANAGYPRAVEVVKKVCAEVK